MRFINPLLKNVVYPAFHQTRILKRFAAASGCAVVNYHGVLPVDHDSRDAFLDGNLVSSETLQKQLKFLKTHYEVISPDAYRSWVQTGNAVPTRSVLVTCDDGLLNNLTDMLPVLLHEGIHCLFFVTGASCSEDPGMLWYEELYQMFRSGQLGRDDLRSLVEDDKKPVSAGDFQSVWWSAVVRASRWERPVRETLWRRLRQKYPSGNSRLSERRWRLLNVHELQQLSQAGMTIGAHTMSHPVLSECNDAESFREIKDSKIALEHALGQPVWAFAYPFGNPGTMGEREVDLARRAGFECAFLNVGGGSSDRAQNFELSRTHVTSDTSLAELEAHMVGFHARLQKVVRG
jgi:peptidoglycan/xylan/chitin deacetylase (PgdA/CDA1 family)